MTEETQKQDPNMKKIIKISVMAGLGTLILGAAIAFFIRSSQYGTFQDDTYKLSIKYPKNWTVRKNYGGTSVVIVAPQDNSLDSFRENLNIAVEDLPPDIKTLKMFTMQARTQLESLVGRSLDIVESEEFVFKGMSAYRYTVRNKISPAIQLNFIWYFKDDKVYMITTVYERLFQEKYSKIFDYMVNSYSDNQK